MKQLDKIEKLLEYNYHSNNYLHCLQKHQSNTASLKRSPGNIHLMGENERIRHDIDVLIELMGKIQKELIEQTELENDILFKYLIRRDAKKINGSAMEESKKQEKK